MGFEGHYRRLEKGEEAAARPRRRWLRKGKGKALSFRLSSSPSKRVKWMRFSIVMIPKRVSEFYAEVLRTLRVDAVFPAINFSSQWGLPVLSHPSVLSKKRQVLSLQRKLHLT